jgi:hypothetical protein
LGCQFAEHSTENVGTGGEIARADAIADLLGLQRRHCSKGCAELGGNRSAGGCDELVRLIDLTERDAHENFESRWRRKRKRPVRAVDDAAAVMQAGDEDLFHAKRLDPDASAYDIRDGIQRSDFVKLHVCRGLPVDLSFGDRDPLEDAERMFFHER